MNGAVHLRPAQPATTILRLRVDLPQAEVFG
jgi:hypothetical protein